MSNVTYNLFAFCSTFKSDFSSAFKYTNKNTLRKEKTFLKKGHSLFQLKHSKKCVMKTKIILTIVWTSFCVCERQQRSTVLTDESKRIVEHFDFSNFDKQEALNYIDRQRYENQIRGKRSQTRSETARDHNGNSQNIPGLEIEPNDLVNKDKNNIPLGSDLKTEIFQNYVPELPKAVCKTKLKLTEASNRAARRGHGNAIKNRQKYKSTNYKEDNNEGEEHKAKLKGYRKKKKVKKKKKKKKKRKKKKKKRKKRRHYWDKWSEWSPCSVTCGRGRKIRWRKCIVKKCRNGELEMGEKTCQLPACNLLTKLLGIGSH